MRGLTVGFVPGVTVTKWSRTWAERFPRIPLEVIAVEQRDQRAAIDHGRVDLCFVRLPLDADGLHVIPLYEEVAVVVVPKSHPVSLFEQVSLEDLSGEQLLEADDIVEAFAIVAAGGGVLVVPHSLARSHSRRDLVFRPVSDASATRISLAWLADDPADLVEDFIGIVRGRTANSSRSRFDSTSAPPTPTRSSSNGKAASVSRRNRPAQGGGRRPKPRRGR